MKNPKFEKWAIPFIKKVAKVVLVEHFYPVKIEWQKEIRGNAIAAFNFTHPYQWLIIQYTDRLVEEWKKSNDYAKNVLTHEVCHALTDPLYNAGWQRFTGKDQLEDEREKLTDHIANIVLKNNLV